MLVLYILLGLVLGPLILDTIYWLWKLLLFMITEEIGDWRLGKGDDK